MPEHLANRNEKDVLPGLCHVNTRAFAPVNTEPVRTIVSSLAEDARFKDKHNGPAATQGWAKQKFLGTRMAYR